MPDAKITVAAQDLASAVLQQVGASSEQLGQKVNATGVQFNALKKATDELLPSTASTSGAFTGLKDALENPGTAARSLAGALVDDLMPAIGGVSLGALALVGGLTIAGAELISLGNDAEQTGAGIGRTALLFNTSVASVSNLRFAIKSAGGDFDSFGNVLFMFQNRMENSSATVDKGLRAIGLSIDSIKGLSADQQFLAISDAFRSVDTSVNKSAAAFDIFGRQGRDILPTLLKPLSDLSDESERLGDTWSDRDVAAARAFRAEVTKLGAETEEAWTVLGRDVAPVTDALVVGWDRMKLALANVALTALELVTLKPIAGWLGENALAAEIAAAKQDTITRAMEMGAPAGIKYAQAIAYINQQYKDMEPSSQKAAEAAQAWLKKFGETELAASRVAAADALLTEGLAEQGIVRGTTIEEINTYTEASKKAAEEAKKEADAHHKIADELLKVEHSLTDIPASLEKIGRSYDESKLGVTADALAKVEQTAQLVNFGYRGMQQALHDVGEATKVAIDEADKWAFVGPQLDPLVAKVRSFSDILGDVPKTLQSALTGGGGVGGFVKAMGSDVGQNLGQSLTDNLTSHLTKDGATALSPLMGTLVGAIPMIGSMIGPLLGPIMNGLKSLFGGVSQAEQDGRKLESSFEQSFGGFKGMMDAVGKGYAAAGLGAAQAQADVQKLMAAEKQGAAATQAAIDTINANIKAGALAVSGGVQGILDAATVVGRGFPASMQPVIAQLAALPGLTDAEKNSLLGLVHAGEPSFNDLSQAAGRYGLTLDTIGGKAGQLSISHEADQVEQDYKTLVTDSGADSDKVLAGMKDSLTKLVNHAMAAGDVLPTALKPLVDQLFNTGQLTDDAGNKITDLSKLKFDDTGDPLATGMKSLTDAINHLGDLLSPSGLPATAASAAAAIGASLGGIKAPEISLHYRYEADNEPPAGASFANEGFDISTPTRAVVGDNPLQSESVLHASTVRDIVRASRQAGASASGGDSAAIGEKLDALSATLRTQLQAFQSAMLRMPRMMAEAQQLGGYA